MKHWLILVAFLLFAAPCRAAVTVDNTCTDIESFTDRATCTLTIGASAKPVFVYATGYAGGAFSVQTVTVGSCSATKQGSSATQGHQTEELWACAAPPTGSQVVTATWGAGTTQRTWIGVISFNGSDGTFGTPVTGNGTASPASVTVSSATNNLVSDGTTQNLRLNNVTCAASSLTAGGSQTQQWTVCADGGGRASGSTQAGGASITMSWTVAGTGALGWTQIAADVHASGGGPPPCTNFIALLGAGCK